MRKIALAFLLATSCLIWPTGTLAQVVPTSIPATVSSDLTATESATPSAEETGTVSAQVVQRIQEKRDQDITETGGKQKDRLATFLDENPPQPLSWNNFVEHAVRYAVNNGVPANIIVLIILFPLIASFIAASRHVIGLRGFGIYIPAVLSVALVSTGLWVGLLMFIAITSVAIFSKRTLKYLHLPYLPRTAMLLWMISLALLGVFIVAPFFDLASLMSVNIFPILILILLSENFLDAQASTKPSDAIALALETIGLAFVSGLILRWEFMQRVALLDPELLILSTAIINIIIGKFIGLRVTEWLRFRPIIEE